MLDTIRTPDDIRGLTIQQQTALAAELRAVILRTVSQNGGHLSSSLGAVELTIALHEVYHAPQDKILFDVGHQAYAHKLLTGRYARFDTLRRLGGVGGFLNPRESAYDPCITGHASSALSVALGMARARDLRGSDERIVAVVGDGALTGGMCYEALNDAGQSQTALVVVLNDNEMSISRNVGALSTYLGRLRRSTPYRLFKRGLRRAVTSLPRMRRALERIKDSLKSLLLDDHYFASLGFNYYGPIDGHDIAALTVALADARNADKPVLLHVVTKKGKGYAPAEAAPDRYHGASPFRIETGEPLAPARPGFGDAACRALIEAAEADERVVAVTAAMTRGTGFTPFQKAYPARLFDVGIAEEHAVAMAAGLAGSGYRPYVAIYSTFLQRSYDQMIEDVCLPRLPVVFLADRAGLVGADGATHQGAFDLAYGRAMPGMIVAAPRGVRDLARMIRLSLTLDRPMLIRYPRDIPPDVPEAAADAPLWLGSWEMLTGGRAVILLAVGRMVSVALAAAALLPDADICVVDARFVKPMDERMLRTLATGARLVVTLEEGVVSGGFGEGVARTLAEWGIDVKTRALGLPDRFVAQGTVAQQLADCGLTPPQVAETIREALAASAAAAT